MARIFHALLLNFTWWVNREDAEGNNLIEGGFLGLDNIGLFDTSKPLPGGGTLEQSDGTAWAAMYALGLMRIAMELTAVDPGHENLVAKFFEHFIYISSAIQGDGLNSGLWDETDQFYYNRLRVPGEGATRIYGGNSNWRGPVWMPVNYLLIEALRELDRFYGAEFTMPVPTGGDHPVTLGAIADLLSERLQGLFLKDGAGRRPFIGDHELALHDPAFADLVQFNEYFHGDTGRGLGAAHQTGWTGLVALLIAQSTRENLK